jgi:hypothetical protein
VTPPSSGTITHRLAEHDVTTMLNRLYRNIEPPARVPSRLSLFSPISHAMTPPQYSTAHGRVDDGLITYHDTESLGSG